ncbi:macrolide ABC transporter permease/ATP-binding protein MacB [Campylobacter sp. MIT 12-8780]|uniref:ABC transporter permease n=1 Tax=unclassified Campylobacter TaxID=2593542 RepID=UPI00115D3B11|nr:MULTISPECIES: ABC transporter permease [unclassified Campylobacter]NDJ26590.1 ATP-binding cassette domain-containing protein [Campylobacter sp. MIT 19-121]TQR43156.1 macrolide ABC transporter permease/ATP-binding protein MacB [Campylobacter sp. MIT 12-8780]
MISLENIYKQIGQTSILQGINLHIEKGEFVAIIGQSGSGKTSLLNIIGTLDEPSSGFYRFQDYEVTMMSKDEKARLRREKIGFIFQRYNLLSLLSAKENVALPAVYAGKSTESRNTRAKELLKELELDHKLDSKPNELSGGQQQRVSIARALMNGGELILADEPTGALDSKSGVMVLEILKELNAKGHTIILVTHDPSIAAQAKRIIEIKDGQIIKDSQNSTQIAQNKDLNSSKTISKVSIKAMPSERKTYNLLKNQLFECFKIAYSSIIAHKLRSLLTMLGIIIGIASVVCVVALGLGSQEQVLASISRLGTNTIEIRAGRGFGDIRSGKTRLNLSDVSTLRSLPYLEAVEPQDDTSGTIVYKNIMLNARAEGVGINEFSIKGYELELGRILNEHDIATSANVAVIDHNGRNALFKDMAVDEILGKVFIFANKAFKVIGVLKKDPNRRAEDTTIRIYMPFSTLMNKLTGDKLLDEIVAKVKDDASPSVAEQAIIRALEIKRGQKDFFTINSDAIRQSIEENTRTMTILITSIALIALIVGGIGVMNIMLVSVSERTREIGIRMAIGARKEDILMQFLIEAIMICCLGAVLGILLSFAVVQAFNILSPDFKMIVSISSVFLGLLSSVFIGVVFGFFPAKNAANLNPINALSKE